MIKAALPPQAALTCGSELPLHLSIKKLTSYRKVLLLQNVHITLTWRTCLRVRGMDQVDTQCSILQSVSNLNAEVGRLGDIAGTETQICPRVWKGEALSKSLVPSFGTCNISRVYTLDVLLGFQYGPPNVGLPKYVYPICLPLTLHSFSQGLLSSHLVSLSLFSPEYRSIGILPRFLLLSRLLPLLSHRLTIALRSPIAHVIWNLRRRHMKRPSCIQQSDVVLSRRQPHE